MFAKVRRRCIVRSLHPALRKTWCAAGRSPTISPRAAGHGSWPAFPEQIAERRDRAASPRDHVHGGGFEDLGSASHPRKRWPSRKD
jgi:hypothetical protein